MKLAILTGVLALAYSLNSRAADCELGGSPTDRWPSQILLTNQTSVTNWLRLAKGFNYDWRKATYNGPYQRNGDYLNFSQAFWNPVTGSLSTNDVNGVVMVSYDQRKTFEYNPTTIAQYVFWLHSLHMKGQALSPRFRANADHLLVMQGEDGAVRYPFGVTAIGFYWLDPGWVSGMAQGQCVSAFLRAYKLLGDEKYLVAARKATEFLLKDFTEGGCTGSLEDLDPSLHRFKIIQEFPTRPETYTLNGWAFALLGLYDMTEFDPELMCVFKQYVEAFRNVLPYYDLGGFSSYDLQHMLGRKPSVAAIYHYTNTQLVWALDSIVPHPDLGRIWRTWAKYAEQTLPEPEVLQYTTESDELTLRWGHHVPMQLQQANTIASPLVWQNIDLPPGFSFFKVSPTNTQAIYRLIEK